jgi:hypothetical protein
MREKEEERPSASPAHSFRLYECGDPGCGLHIVAFSENDRPMCEIVVGQEVLLHLVGVAQAILYNKITQQDDEEGG